MSRAVGRPRVRLVALDIDGTLLRSDKSLSPRTRVAVERARSSGARVVLVTGRRYPSALLVADELGGELPLVLHNGALVIERAEVLRCRPLSAAAAREAIGIGRACGAEPVLHCGARGEGLLLVDAAARREGLVGYYLERSRDEVRPVADLLAAVAAAGPLQVMFGGSREAMLPLAAALTAGLAGRGRIERTEYPATGVVLLDVIDPTVGKADAVAFLQGLWGITAAETLAVGDNWNDREMVAAAGRGFFMGNALPELLALGLPVLPTNDEDGVARAIESHVLVDA